MFAALGRVLAQVGAKVIPKAAPPIISAPARLVGKSGVAVEAAASKLAQVAPQARALMQAGIQPVVKVSPWTAVPWGARLKVGAAVAGLGAGAGLLGVEALKAAIKPPAYGQLPTVGPSIPGTPDVDKVTTDTGVKTEGIGSWLSGLLGNPAVQAALGLTGVGAMGLGAYKLLKRRKAKRKKVKRYRKVKKYRRVRRRPTRRVGRMVKRRRRGSGRPGRTIRGMKVGSHRWMAYIRGLRTGGRRRKPKAEMGRYVHEKIMRRTEGRVTAGMKRQQAKMRAGARAWKRSGKRGSYRDFMSSYLRR